MVALRNLQAQGQQDQLMNPLRVQEAQQVIQQHQLANQQNQKQLDIANRMERAYQSALDRTRAASVNTPPPQATSPTPAISEAAPPALSGATQSGNSGLSGTSEASAPDAEAQPGMQPANSSSFQPMSSLGTNPPVGAPGIAISGLAAGTNPMTGQRVYGTPRPMDESMGGDQGQAAPPIQPRTIPTAPPPRTASPADNWNGAPPGFYAALEDEFYKNGLGAQVPGMQKAHAELGIQMSKNVSDAALAHQQQAEQATQLLQGIRNIQDPAQQQAEYQKIRPQFQRLEAAMGSDISQIPRAWNNTAMDAYIAQGFKVQEYGNHIHQAAEQARLMHQGVLTDAPKAAEYFQKELGGVTSPQQYAELRQRISNLAEAEKTAAPNGTSFYQQVLDNNPKEWNQGMQRQATLASMPPNDRPTFLQHDFANTAQRLSAAAQQGADQYAAQLATVAPEDRSLFDQKWSKDTAENARRTGLTASQVGVEDLKDRALSVSQMKAEFYEALSQARTDKLKNPAPTAAEQKNTDMGLARQIRQAHGGDIDASVRDLNQTEPDGSYTYYNGHGADQRRGAVSQALSNIKTQEGKDAGQAARTAEAGQQSESDKILEELMRPEGKPGAGKPGTPKPAAAQAAPAPAARPQAQGPNGHIIEYNGKQWVDKQTQKPVAP